MAKLNYEKMKRNDRCEKQTKYMSSSEYNRMFPRQVKKEMQQAIGIDLLRQDYVKKKKEFAKEKEYLSVYSAQNLHTKDYPRWSQFSYCKERRDTAWKALQEAKQK